MSTTCVWEEVFVSTDGDSLTGDMLGFVVSIAGDTVLVASPRADDTELDVGSLTIYNNISNKQNGTPNNNNNAVLYGQAAHETWGYSAAISSDAQTVVAGVGLYANDPSHTTVRVFHQSNNNNNNGTTWKQRGLDIRGSSNFKETVTAVAVSQNGTVVAVGHSLATIPYREGGRASIWELVEGERWKRKGSSAMFGTEEGEQFGFSISISADGNIVAVGAPYNRRTGGVVRVFEYVVNGDWQRIGQTLTGELPTNYFGYSLDLSPDGSTVVIGSYNERNLQTGKVWVYAYDHSTQAWRVKGDAMHEEEVGGQAGFAVAISADASTVAVGAPLHNGKGRVRVYQFVEETQQWLVKGNDLHGDNVGDNFGYSVSIGDDGSRLAVGSPTSDDHRGKFNVYQWDKFSGCLREQPKVQAVLPSSISVQNRIIFAVTLLAALLLLLARGLMLFKRHWLEKRYWPKSQSVPKSEQGQEEDHAVDYCICSHSQDTDQGYLEQGVQHLLDKQTSLRGSIINEAAPNNAVESDFIDIARVVHTCRFGIVFLTDRFLQSDRCRMALNTLYHRNKERAKTANFQLILFYQRESLMKSVPEYRCFNFINAKIRESGIDNRKYLVENVLPVLLHEMDCKPQGKDDESLHRHLDGLLETFHHSFTVKSNTNPSHSQKE